MSSVAHHFLLNGHTQALIEQWISEDAWHLYILQFNKWKKTASVLWIWKPPWHLLNDLNITLCLKFTNLHSDKIQMCQDKAHDKCKWHDLLNCKYWWSVVTDDSHWSPPQPSCTRVKTQCNGCHLCWRRHCCTPAIWGPAPKLLCWHWGCVAAWLRTGCAGCGNLSLHLQTGKQLSLHKIRMKLCKCLQLRKRWLYGIFLCILNLSWLHVTVQWILHCGS